MSSRPIYFRVINKDLQSYTQPNNLATKSIKLEKGDIYVAVSEKNGWLKIDNTTFCTNSPNSIVKIPVNDIVEINGKYRVKEDIEDISGMSRRSGIDVNNVTSWVIVGMILSFIPIIIFTLFFTWNSQDSTPLTTLIGCYAGVISLITGLYAWKKKNSDIVNLKKTFNKKNLDSEYVDDLEMEQERTEDFRRYDE